MNSVSKKKLISIVAGGTGGHIFPAISLIKFLKDKYNILIITMSFLGSSFFQTNHHQKSQQQKVNKKVNNKKSTTYTSLDRSYIHHTYITMSMSLIKSDKEIFI